MFDKFFISRFKLDFVLHCKHNMFVFHILYFLIDHTFKLN